MCAGIVKNLAPNIAPNIAHVNPSEKRSELAPSFSASLIA